MQARSLNQWARVLPQSRGERGERGSAGTGIAMLTVAIRPGLLPSGENGLTECKRLIAQEIPETAIMKISSAIRYRCGRADVFRRRDARLTVPATDEVLRSAHDLQGRMDHQQPRAATRDVSRTNLPIVHRRPRLRPRVRRIEDGAAQPHRQHPPSSDVAGVGAAARGLRWRRQRRAIVLTNQRAPCWNWPAWQVGLMANADLSGLAITMR